MLKQLTFTKKTFGRDTFYRAQEDGIEFCCDSTSDQVKYITLTNGKCHDGVSLPFGLVWKMTNQDIVRRFGDTPDKGGYKVPVWLEYKKIGIGFTFLNASFTDAENPIIFITIFKRFGEADDIGKQDVCAICLVKVVHFYNCETGCNLKFCSKECRENFNKIHMCPREKLLI